MAATDHDDIRPADARLGFGSITLAALALPGLLNVAHAESAPTDGVLSVKLQSYDDRQPGLDRIRVIAPSLYVLAPVASNWALEASLVHDDISGASPRWHSAISGASHMSDHRTAGTARVTRYFDRISVGVGGAFSEERDYRSRAASLDVRWSTPDNNTTLYLGAGLTRDDINPVNGVVENEHKRSNEFMIGVTQAWTKNDLVQLNVGHVAASGYFNDPYKLVDKRPRERDQTTALARWNHHIEPLAVTIRSSYRFYRDTFGIRAHTATVEGVHPLGDRFTLTPSLRYYTQGKADFYYDPVYDPVIGEPYPPGRPRLSSSDHRLSAFGAITVGAKLAWRIDSRWSADFKYERYEQRSNWRLGGNGSPGLARLSADILQIGFSRRF